MPNPDGTPTLVERIKAAEVKFDDWLSGLKAAWDNVKNEHFDDDEVEEDSALSEFETHLNAGEGFMITPPNNTGSSDNPGMGVAPPPSSGTTGSGTQTTSDTTSPPSP